jgi:hypothetical protein
MVANSAACKLLPTVLTRALKEVLLRIILSLPLIKSLILSTPKSLLLKIAPLPKRNESLPSPPVRISFPFPPIRVSFPALPRRVSLPSNPLSRLLPLLPVMRLSRLLPVPLVLSLPAKVRSSMLTVRV